MFNQAMVAGGIMVIVLGLGQKDVSLCYLVRTEVATGVRGAPRWRCQHASLWSLCAIASHPGPGTALPAFAS